LFWHYLDFKKICTKIGKNCTLTLAVKAQNFLMAIVKERYIEVRKDKTNEGEKTGSGHF